MTDAVYLILISLITFVAVYGLIYCGWGHFMAMLERSRLRYERVLVHQLLIDIDPRAAVALSFLTVVGSGLIGWAFVGHYLWFFIGAGIGAILPYFVVCHLEVKRRQHLERQLVDGITTLSSGVRAGLNLVQSMELLVHNSPAPMKQEFAQLLREYQMGLDLNQAMHNAANRVGSTHYRLLFTALEMHRRRGGDAGESLDRIADSIREMQRLEGRLDTLTASGRFQAWAMSAAPLLLLGMWYFVEPDQVNLLIEHPYGRIMLLLIASLIITAFIWIRKIMAVDM